MWSLITVRHFNWRKKVIGGEFIVNGHVLIQAKDIDVECAGRRILDIAQLEIYEYDRIALVGANGVGKTTLMKVLLGETQWQNGIVKHGDIKRNGTFSYFSQ